MFNIENMACIYWALSRLLSMHCAKSIFLLGTTTEYVRLHCGIYTGNLKNPS
jgi:hypothetical protein